MDKKPLIKAAMLVILVPMLTFPTKEITGIRAFNDVPDSSLYNTSVHADPDGKKIFTISDLTYEKNRLPYITDIALSFNSPSSVLIEDDTRKYQIKNSNYLYITGKGSVGKGCAGFFKNDHYVEILTAKNLWLGSSGDLGSFTIEMRFMPQSFSTTGVLFSRIGLFSGEKKGIDIVVKNSRISAGFYNVFERNEKKRYDVYLNRGRMLKTGTWYHLLISFDRITGKLAKYINGREEEVVYITDNNEPYNNVYMPSFGYRDENGNMAGIDLPPAFIGKNFSGLIDEFRITTLAYDELKMRTEIASRHYREQDAAGRDPFNIEGIITSPVYSFESTGTQINLFQWDENLKENTFIWMEFRICDYMFRENDTDLKWYRVKNNQRNIFLMKRGDGDYLRGRYYQWRAHLVASPDGRFSPSLKNLEIHYHLDTSPNPPEYLDSPEAGDRFVILKWKKNVDADIGGYKIYYGTKKDHYDGIITHIKGKKITNEMAQGNYITVTIDNAVIDENREKDGKGLLNFPVLKNTVLYFFAVSACDSYKPDTAYNHESGLSKQISSRPFAGSEID